MGSFILRRFFMALPTLILVGVAVFVLVRLIPGDPAALMLGDSADVRALEALRQRMGLDRNLPEQFFLWAGNILQGDFGHSIVNGRPVLDTILSRFQISAQVVIVAVVLATFVAVPLGMLAAWRQNKLSDLVLVSCATLLMSVPTFWLGMLLLLFFGLHLGWLPIVGYVTLAEDFRAGALYLVLPIVTLFLHETGVILRMARASTLEVLNLDYITHARSKGLPESTVMWRHAFRASFGPTWTLLGLIMGNLLAGVAVIETVFTIPGLGRLLVEAIFARDYPVIQGCLLFIAAIYVLVNLLIDLMYPLFDPRVTAQ
ncbi:ABC transporter permease [Mesorhizobium australicum]|uniref:Peptide/nickel transport system permease protein n=1 Tax=Mesorhizobium australicum TaxID=536018 RepID=A0A1X7PP59_9HYPH|nr:ABC transporter permease [Mesorhizobium australicum]SMH53743.1 peptide/nickel transport system permease protein [Mesorhizobium australicum]